MLRAPLVGDDRGATPGSFVLLLCMIQQLHLVLNLGTKCILTGTNVVAVLIQDNSETIRPMYKRAPSALQ
jgi:hypothetical protein